MKHERVHFEMLRFPGFVLSAPKSAAFSRILVLLAPKSAANSMIFVLPAPKNAAISRIFVLSIPCKGPRNGGVPGHTPTTDKHKRTGPRRGARHRPEPLHDPYVTLT